MRVGVVTCRPETKLADVARMTVRCDISSLTAGEVASTDLITIHSNESRRRAAELMAEHAVTHLIAVQPDTERPAGVISARGLAAALAYGRS